MNASLDQAVLLDATTLMYRAYFALPPLASEDGFPTQCLVGMNRMLEVLRHNFPFSHAAACFDRPEATFRHEAYKEYKAHRAKPEDDFIAQIEPVKELIRLHGIEVLEKKGYEADDLIATLARKLGEEMPVLIFTTDQDLFSLLRGNQVEMAYLKKGVTEVERITEQRFRQKYGILPGQWVDVKILKGDPSDNIPGVPGIGERTALRLIQEYGSIEEILKHLECLPPRQRELLSQHAEKLPLWKKLVHLRSDVDLEVEKDTLKKKDVDQEKLENWLSRYSFKKKALVQQKLL